MTRIEIDIYSDFVCPWCMLLGQRTTDLTKRNLSLKVKRARCANNLFGQRFQRLANCSIEGRAR